MKQRSALKPALRGPVRLGKTKKNASPKCGTRTHGALTDDLPALGPTRGVELPNICKEIYIYVYICFSLYLFTCIYLFMYLFVYLFIYLFVDIFICLLLFPLFIHRFFNEFISKHFFSYLSINIASADGRLSFVA